MAGNAARRWNRSRRDGHGDRKEALHELHHGLAEESLNHRRGKGACYRCMFATHQRAATRKGPCVPQYYRPDYKLPDKER
jgi:hypothetical protein